MITSLTVSDPFQIQSLTPASAAAGSLWRIGGRVHVVVVVKATFDWVPDGPMTPADPIAVQADELVPYLPGADVCFAGRAYPRDGRRVARMALLSGGATEQSLIDKTVPVSASTDGPTNAAAVGVLLAQDRDHYRADASFAPIPADFPERIARLGPRAQGWASQDVREIDEDFDWSYFRTAPADQCAPWLQGDEWLVLEGLTADHETLKTQLSGATASVRVLDPKDPAVLLPLSTRADMLRVDGELRQCSILWRGSFPVANMARVWGLQVWAHAGMPGATGGHWPPTLAALPPSLAPELAAKSIAASSSRARPAGSELSQSGPPSAAAAPRAPAAQPQPIVATPPRPSAVADEDSLSGTVGLTSTQQVHAAVGKATPFGSVPKRKRKGSSLLGAGVKGTDPPAKKPLVPAGMVPPQRSPLIGQSRSASSSDPLEGTVGLSATQDQVASGQQVTPFQQQPPAQPPGGADEASSATTTENDSSAPEPQGED